MRELFIGGRYLLDQGRGAYVELVQATDTFVIVKPAEGGAEAVLERANFDETAILEQRFRPHNYSGSKWHEPVCFIYGEYSPAGVIQGHTSANNNEPTLCGLTPYGPTELTMHGWVIDLRLVNEEAWVKHG